MEELLVHMAPVQTLGGRTKLGRRERAATNRHRLVVILTTLGKRTPRVARARTDTPHDASILGLLL